MDAIPGLFQPHTFAGDDKPLSSRRGTKRPVAADFVDLEPGPSKLAKGIPDFFRANIRRKTAGFAGLTQRRCVIDLSDSEGDDNETAGPGGFPQWTDPRASQVVTPQATAAPTPRIRSPIITPSITPSVLQEKEEAIRRMRELIAQREESRKKKIEVVSDIASALTRCSTVFSPRGLLRRHPAHQQMALWRLSKRMMNLPVSARSILLGVHRHRRLTVHPMVGRTILKMSSRFSLLFYLMVCVL